MMRLPLLLPALTLFASAIVPLHAEAELVQDLGRGPGSFSAAIAWVMPVDQGVVFQMDSIAHGRELWASDGTSGGTLLLRDIIPGSLGSEPSTPLQAGSRVAFRAKGEDGADKLWFTDGIDAGTLMVLDTVGFDGPREIETLAGLDHGILFHVINRGNSSRQLWFSDGTAAGTLELPMGRGFDFNPAGSLCYFIARNDEIWRSDGTLAGTVDLGIFAPETIPGGYLSDLTVAESRFYLTISFLDGTEELWTCHHSGADLVRLGPAETGTWREIESIVTAGDRAIWFVEDSQFKRALWTSEGTPASTHELTAVNSGNSSYHTDAQLVVMEGAAYFTATGNKTGPDLWRCDGTQEGTTVVKQSRREPDSYYSPKLLVTGDLLSFSHWSPSNGVEMWQTDGTPQGTRRTGRLVDASVIRQSGPVVARSGGTSFFAANATGLWTDDALWVHRPVKRGLRSLTVPEKSTASAFAYPSQGNPPYVGQGGGLLALVGRELWKVGGSGPSRALRVLPATGYPARGFLGQAGGRSVFSLESESFTEIWSTNGTAKGTRRLVRHEPYFFPQDSFQSGDILYYVTGKYWARQIWRTDGTAAGTRQIFPAHPSIPAVTLSPIVELQGALYFIVSDGFGHQDLWRSDGTFAGTVKVSLTPFEGGYHPQYLTVVGDELAFSTSGIYYQKHWRSDGTAAGTYSHVNPDLQFLSGTTGRSVDLGGLQIFHGRAFHGAPLQWYRTDGTGPGTAPVRPGLTTPHLPAVDDTSGFYAVANSQLFYRGIDASGGAELWITDGTAAGSRRVKDIVPGTKSSGLHELYAAGDRVYFSAETPEHGRELWVSDGTEDGTHIAADIEPGPAGSSPQGLKLIDGKLYFTADRKALGRELYVLDLE
jgi:ELWxxDGT repeat protein